MIILRVAVQFLPSALSTKLGFFSRNERGAILSARKDTILTVRASLYTKSTSQHGGSNNSSSSSGKISKRTSSLARKKKERLKKRSSSLDHRASPASTTKDSDQGTAEGSEKEGGEREKERDRDRRKGGDGGDLELVSCHVSDFPLEQFFQKIRKYGRNKDSSAKKKSSSSRQTSSKALNETSKQKLARVQNISPNFWYYDADFLDAAPDENAQGSSLIHISFTPSRINREINTAFFSFPFLITH